MKFWDSSALIPLCLSEPRSAAVEELARADEAMAVWWASPVECCSAFARLRREGILTTGEEDAVRGCLSELAGVWTEIQPSEAVRERAAQLLLRHALRAADALQLAAAVQWAGPTPQPGPEFVCLDGRLRQAARGEGFTILPHEVAP